MRALETYGADRFHLDSQIFWTELISVVPDQLRSECDQARASVDFFVALVYLSTTFGIGSLVAGILLLTGEASINPTSIHWKLLVVGSASLVLCRFWYNFAILSSSWWAGAVRALVNVGRSKFASAMNLTLPPSLAEERHMWDLLTRLVFYGFDPKVSSELDRFRVSTAPSPAKS
jgi:hypothetical protein